MISNYTGCTVEEIKVLINLNANILHVFNSCEEKKTPGDINQAPTENRWKN